MTLYALTLLAVVHGLQQRPYSLRCPDHLVAAAVARVEADEAAGRRWAPAGLVALAKREVCG